MRIALAALLLAACGRTRLGEQPPQQQQQTCALGASPVNLLPGGEPAGATLLNIVAAGGYVYFNDSNGEGGRFTRVPGNGGATETIDDGPVSDFAIDGDVVAFEPETVEVQPDNTWVHRASSLRVRNLSTAEVIDSPFEPSTATLTTLAVNAGGDVFVRAYAPRDSDYLAEWDGQAHRYTQRSDLFPSVMGFWSDGTQLVWLRNDTTTHVIARDAKLAAAPVELTSVPGGALSTFVGLDSTSVLFVTGDPGAQVGLDTPRAPFSLTAIPRTGGAATVVFTSPGSYLVGAVAADDTHVYWLDEVGHDRTDLYRASRSGGGAELLATTPTFTSALALDGCNVYALGQTSIWALAK